MNLVRFRILRRRGWLPLLLVCGGLHPAAGLSSFAAGITEPPVTFYGTVSQTADGYTVPITSGTLNWTVKPPSGAAMNLSAALSSLSGQSGMYRMKIPVEKVMTASTVSASATGKAINEPDAAASYDRRTVNLNGSTPLSISYPTGAAAGAFSFNQIGRGKTDRVDLVLTMPFTDSDGDGLPDWFEDKYGLDKYNPADGAAFDKRGQRTLLYDYQHHIDPMLGTEYEQWADAKIPATAPAMPAADADGDGVSNLLEFALDTDPQAADAGLSRQRVAQSVATVANKRYLALNVALPATPRATVTYIVESSADLVNWAGVEGADVVTVSRTASQLQVRDAKSPDDPGNAQRFLRLRAVLNDPQ